MKSVSQKDICTPMFIAVLFTLAKIWKQPKYPLMDEWIKMWHTHAYTHILFSHEKEGNPVICETWINLEGIMLSEISQTEKDKYVWYHLSVESKKAEEKQEGRDVGIYVYV